MDYSRTKKICITLGILTFVGILGCYGFYYIIKKKVTSTIALETKIKEFTTNEEKDRTLKLLLEDVKPDMDKLSTRIVSPNGTVSFIESIESLARSKNIILSVKSVQVELYTEEKEVYEKLMLSVNTQGTWNAQSSFLELLESMPYKLRVESVSFIEGGDQERSVSKGVWTGSFVISVLKKK